MEVEIFGKPRNLLRLLLLIPFLLLIFSFWGEFVTFMRGIKWGENIGPLVNWLVWGREPIPEISVRRAFAILFFNFVAFSTLAVTWLFMIADQAVLPVTRPLQVLVAAIYLVFHLLGFHGMAAYVRNGKIKAWVEELQLLWPGVVVVDYNSAVAVEKIILPPGIVRTVMLVVRWVARLFGLNTSAIYVQDAGVIFTLPDERIHGANDLIGHPDVSDPLIWMSEILGVVDLRNQFRMSARQPHPLSKRLGSAVYAYTRDGIEVKTNISVIATLGQDPVPYFPLNVTYAGAENPDNLRSVRFSTVSQNPPIYRVESIVDDLDPLDCLEIHQQLQSELRADVEWVAYTDAPRPPLLPSFDPKRVFDAIYGRARHLHGLGTADEIVPWADLPIHVAIDLFREIISRYNYDEIIDVGGNRGRSGEIRSKLGAAVRNSGLIAYRPVFHYDGEPLRKGELYAANALVTIPASSAFSLRNSKVLRDRGIRIIMSSFGDLSVDERIYKQRLDRWLADWEQQTQLKEMQQQWEALRIRTQVRTQAQQEFVQELAQVYRANGSSKEILALRVLQALEAVIADPKTRQLLPEETIAMLRTIHDWILPEDIGS
jgi:hypothetical protein